MYPERSSITKTSITNVAMESIGFRPSGSTHSPVLCRIITNQGTNTQLWQLEKADSTLRHTYKSGS
jgi:hypothetical protein